MPGRAPFMSRMLRVGYPAILPAELFRDFPEGIELIPLPDELDHDVEIDVWIPDPYPTGRCAPGRICAACSWCFRMMAGTEWIPALVGPHVTICNARGAHNISHRRVDARGDPGDAEILSALLRYSADGQWKRRFEASAHYAAITGDTRPYYPPVMLEELTGKTVLLVGLWRDRQRDRAHARAVSRGADTRWRVQRAQRSEVHAVSELDTLLPQAEVVVLILPSTAETQRPDRRAASLR